MTAVLVTRPVLLAMPTIERLRGLGYNVLHEPLMTIHPIQTPRPRLSVKPMVVISSRTTLEVMASRKDDMGDLLACPCYCVGQKTAEAARHFGFMDIKRAAMDGEHLAQIILAQEKPSRPALIVGGAERSDAFETQLRKNGWNLYAWVVYNAEPATSLPENLKEALQHRLIDAVLLYSPRSARVFGALIKDLGLESCCHGLTAIGLSAAVINELSTLPFKMLLTANQPTETALLDKLVTTCPA